MNETRLCHLVHFENMKDISYIYISSHAVVRLKEDKVKYDQPFQKLKVYEIVNVNFS